MPRVVSDRRGFSLVELLVVVGIAAILLALILPSLARVRSAARLTKCESNLSQISIGFAAYVAENGGKYPPNVSSPAPGMYWSDPERIGRFLSTHAGVPGTRFAGNGSVFVCPDDVTGAISSYSQNVWSSSAIDSNVKLLIPAQAVTWTAHSDNSAKLLLVTESWASSGSDTDGWYANSTVGASGVTAIQRFGAQGGISPPFYARRFGNVVSELNFMRHRPFGSPGIYTQPRGRINIAYADGHVASKTDANFVTTDGHLTGDTYWSPVDWDGR